jgi:hypothetical protein
MMMRAGTLIATDRTRSNPGLLRPSDQKERFMTNSTYEARVRRAAKRLGWRAIKSRVRFPHFNNCGHWQLVDDRNTVIGGDRYEATIDVVEYWINQELARLE